MLRGSRNILNDDNHHVHHHATFIPPQHYRQRNTLLPPELISQIIAFSLPSPSFRTFPKRYTLLTRYHLVNKLWFSIARPHLLQHVWVSTPTAVGHLWSAYGEEELKKMFVKTETLWIGPDFSGSLRELGGNGAFAELAAFLSVRQYCTNLQSLKGAKLSLLGSSDMWILQGLPTLFLRDFMFGAEAEVIAPTISLPFKALTHLTLIDPCLFETIAEDWDDFLNEIMFPSLINLKLLFNKIEVIDGNNLELAIERIAPQLESFAWAEGQIEEELPEIAETFQHFHQLKHLTLNLWEASFISLIPLLSQLSTTSLLSLEIGMLDNLADLNNCFTILTSLFQPQTCPLSLTCLKKVRLTRWEPTERRASWETAKGELERVLRGCGVVLEVQEEDLDYEMYAVVK